MIVWRWLGGLNQEFAKTCLLSSEFPFKFEILYLGLKQEFHHSIVYRFYLCAYRIALHKGIWNMNSERHLLLGLLALQNGLISQPQLLSAFGAWVIDKSRELPDYFVEQQALNREALDTLQKMVDLHLLRFSGDVAKSLANLSNDASSLRIELERLASGDTEANQTISYLLSHEGGKDEFRTTDTAQGGKVGGSERDGETQRFRIVKEHAKGGLGVVFIAEDRQLRREVALKQIRADRSGIPEYQGKFSQEAELTGQLEHPGIVPVYALGTDEIGRPFYVMRLIRGEDLKSRIQKFHTDLKDGKVRFDGPELRGLLRRFMDVCSAIEYAHDRGVLHRDLKPGNVMLGKHGETLVVDWGLAKPMTQKTSLDPLATRGLLSELPISSTDESGPETEYGQFVGTPAYAPPEQLLGQLDKVCPASDVYSLGAILHELLAGSLPKVNTIQDLLESAKAMRHTLRFRGMRIPRPLRAICNKATNPNLDGRYSCVRELRDDVEAFLNDEKVRAMGFAPVDGLGRVIRRNATVWVVLFCILTVLLPELLFSLVDTRVVAAKFGYEAELDSALQQKLRGIIEPYTLVPLLAIALAVSVPWVVSIFLINLFTAYPIASFKRSIAIGVLTMFLFLTRLIGLYLTGTNDGFYASSLFSSSYDVLSWATTFGDVAAALLLVWTLVQTTFWRFLLLWAVTLVIGFSFLIGCSSYFQFEKISDNSYQTHPILIPEHRVSRCGICGSNVSIQRPAGSSAEADYHNYGFCTNPLCLERQRIDWKTCSPRPADQVFINKVVKPRRLDVVHYDSRNSSNRFGVLIGLPGETIEYSSDESSFGVNGKKTAIPTHLRTLPMNQLVSRKAAREIRLGKNEFLIAGEYDPCRRIRGVVTHRIGPTSRFFQFRALFPYDVLTEDQAVPAETAAMWTLSVHVAEDAAWLNSEESALLDEKVVSMERICVENESCEILASLGILQLAKNNVIRAAYCLERALLDKKLSERSRILSLGFLAITYSWLGKGEKAKEAFMLFQEKKATHPEPIENYCFDRIVDRWEKLDFAKLPSRFHIVLSARSLDVSQVEMNVEELADRLSKYDRIDLKVNDSFLWAGNDGVEGPWKLKIYDKGDSVQTIELKGNCPKEKWHLLLKILEWPVQSIKVHSLNEEWYGDRSVSEFEKKIWRN